MNNQHPFARKPGNSFFSYYSVVIASFLIMMLGYGIFYAFGIFLKPLLNEFGWTRAAVAGAFSLSWLVHGVVGIFMGGLNDRFGPRVVLSACGVISCTGYVLVSQISEMWQLYLYYGVFIGAGTAIFVPLMSVIARTYATRRTALSGIATIGIGLGSLLAPLAANEIMLTSSWSTAFIVMGVLILITVVPSAQLLQQRLDATDGKPGIDSEANRGKSPKVAEGLTFKEAVVTRQFWTIFAMFFCMGFIVLVPQVHIAPYATDINITPTIAAGILASIGGASIIGRSVLGVLGDRIGNRNAFVLGFILMTVPVLLLAFVTDAWVLYLLAIVMGIGYGDLVASESPLVAVIFGLKSHGILLGLLGMAFTIGAAVGPVAAAYMFDITSSYHSAFISTAGVGIAGLLFTLILKPIKPG